ncbi:MAG TPA: hypothetical protein VKX46_06045, partial [Ktedonobacteraceae bacterium]|nr:hypothetical protein [Ktedonobacteraceae bacterium]
MPTTEERLPPACTFARSVLAEHDLDPEAVPEEAVEAAQQHMATCALCSQSTAPTTSTGTPRKKKKVRRAASGAPTAPAAPEHTPSSSPAEDPEPILRPESVSRQLVPVPMDEAKSEFTIVMTDMENGHLEDGTIDCLQCRQLLPEYAEALDNGQDVATLYPDIRDHLLTCESGCLVLLDVFRQDAKATRKYRRRPIRTPFGVIGWELTGFFRGGQITTSPMALAYGTLILLLLVATLGGYLGFMGNERLFHPSH